MYWFIIDIVMAAVVVISVIVSAYRGFVSSFIRLLGIIAAIIVSVAAARMLAGPIFDAWFRENMIDSVAERIGGALNIDEVAELLRGGFTGILIGVFGDDGVLASLLESISSLNYQALSADIVDKVIRSPMESVISLAVFIVSFILVSVIVSVIVKLSGALNALPVVGGFNRFLGALFGVAYGIGICYVAVALFAFIFTVTGNGGEYASMIENNTILCALLFRYNPVIRFNG